MSGISGEVFAATVFLTALGGFTAGFLMQPAPVRSGDTRPIVDPEAWNRPVPAILQAPIEANLREPIAPATDVPTARKAKFEIEDDWPTAATSEASYVHDDASLVGLSGSYKIEPLEGASHGDEGSSSITVLTKEESERAWDNWSDADPSRSAATEVNSGASQ